jgi:hypothetical protein
MVFGLIVFIVFKGQLALPLFLQERYLQFIPMMLIGIMQATQPLL